MPKEIAKKDYKLILNDEDLDESIKFLLNSKTISFDLETTSVNPMSAEIVGLSFSTQPHQGFYIPVLFPNNLDTEVVPKINYENFFEKIKPIFNCQNSKYIGQNIKYDILILKRYGIEISGNLFDTMIAAHLLNPDRRSYKMDLLSQD